MKIKIIIPLLLAFSVCSLKAQNKSNQHFRQAFEEITAMLEGKQPLDFERAVFITENAYRENSFQYEDFKSALDVHSGIIEQFIKANDKYDWKQFVRGNMGIAPDMEIEAKERYRKALANWAIFTYLTDTLTVKLEGQHLLHLPYTYSNDDPFGTADWKNSQAMNLLETQNGNCYSLVTLFKIFSERFKSEANIVTAPQHIYIEHRDPKGNRFNVEVATRSFPNMGSIQTLTYTTREALLNDISMRKLDLKQSVGLSLVYLAKGYEYKNKLKDDEFILTCANTALQHDPKNLNALLLKAQVYEQRVMKNQMPSAPYEKMLAEFYKLGYRQMPDDMKEIILSKIQGRPSTVTPTEKTPNTFADIGEQSRTVTLSNGLFEEQHTPQMIVRYGQTIFDTEKSKIIKFLDEDNSSYQVDPVVFALSVDPLTKSFPMLTPYQFASNTPIMAIDLDGLEARTSIKGKFIDGHWTMGSDNFISLATEAELRLKAQQAAMNKPYTPNYGTIQNNDLTSTPAYKFQKEMINTYGDFVLPLEVSGKLIRGEDVSVAELGLEGLGLIPAGKLLGKGAKFFKGIGGDILETFVKKFDNQASHLTDQDLLGAAKDIFGNPVVINGKSYQHLKEVKDAMHGLGKQLNNLNSAIDQGKFSGEVLEQAEKLRSNLQKQKDGIQSVLERVTKKAEEVKKK